MIRDYIHPGKPQWYAFYALMSIKGTNKGLLDSANASSLKGINKYQSGAVLAISLVMLLLLTLIGITGTQTTGLEEKMAGNMRDRNLAFQAAESALNAAEADLSSPTPPTFTTFGTDGYYSSTAATPAIDSDSFWSTGNTHTYSGGTLVGIDTTLQPRYIIHDLDVVDCPGSALGSLGCHNYRITARATGGTSSAVVMLQSIFQL